MVSVIMAANTKLLCEQNKRNLQEICDTNGSSECDDSDKDPDYSFNEEIGKKKKHRKIWPTPLPNNNTNTVSGEPDKENSVRGRKRKRGCNIDQRQQNKRNSGQSYTCKRGKGNVILQKSMGEDCLCKRKCFEVVSADERKSIFQKFWEINNFNTQNAYLFGCMQIKIKARSTKPKDSPSRRSHTVEYLITATGNTRYQICKKAFLNIHGLQHNRGRVENIAKNIKQGLLTPKMDERGRHANKKKSFLMSTSYFLKNLLKDSQNMRVTIPEMTTVTRIL
uniref:Uncharacterized protein LOC114333083 n=1 Tax=Diabrotica virgifera virgifera TaxID=50390 RepID=A0A6P7G288_DIAVI